MTGTLATESPGGQRRGRGHGHAGLPRGPAAPGAHPVAAHRPGHEGAADRPRARASCGSRGLVRLHPGGRIEVVPPDISLPALALDYERRARETRSAAHELAQVYFQARSASRTPDVGTVRILNSMDEIAAVTAEAVAAGTERIRTFRSLSPRTRAVFASPLHSHEEPSRGVGGQRARLRDRLRHRGPGDRRRPGHPRGAGTRWRAVPVHLVVPFWCVIVDEAVAIVDVSAFDPSGFGSAVIRARSMVLALIALSDHLWDLGSPLSSGGLDRRAARPADPVAAGRRGARRDDRPPGRGLPADRRTPRPRPDGPARRRHPVPGRRAGRAPRADLAASAGRPRRLGSDSCVPPGW